MFYAEMSKNVSPKRYPCRDDQSCAAEATKTPPTSPKYFADASKDFADASKIFRRRVQGFRRGVQNISPTRPQYFADASNDFADASRDFAADVVTLPTRPVTVLTRVTSTRVLAVITATYQSCLSIIFLTTQHNIVE